MFAAGSRKDEEAIGVRLSALGAETEVYYTRLVARGSMLAAHLLAAVVVVGSGPVNSGPQLRSIRGLHAKKDLGFAVCALVAGFAPQRTAAGNSMGLQYTTESWFTRLRGCIARVPEV